MVDGIRMYIHKDSTNHDFWHPPHTGPGEHEILLFMWSFGPLSLYRHQNIPERPHILRTFGLKTISIMYSDA